MAALRAVEPPDSDHVPIASSPVIPGSGLNQTRDQLCADGWTLVGVGNWSWAYASPDGLTVARVTPWDPAYRLHAVACLSGPPNRYLPRVESITALEGEGYAVMMERLWPADEVEAAALCGRIGLGNDSGYQIPILPDDPSDQNLAALRLGLKALMAQGAESFTLWGGSDIRPGNIMVDGKGQLKVVDPVFLRGPAIVDALKDGRADLLADFTHEQLRAFLTIPVFLRGPETDELRRRIDLLCPQR